MNDLNVFNNNFLPWCYPANWIKNIRVFFRQFKWAYQRITRGYSDIDWYDMDTHLTMLISQMLRTMADEGMGYPGNEEFPTYDSWKDYLYKIIYYLNYSIQDSMPNEYEDAWLKTWENRPINEWLNKEQSPEDKEVTNKYLDKELENDNKKYAAAQKALKMLAHVWGNLWD